MRRNTSIGSITNHDIDKNLVIHLTSAGEVRTIGSPSETEQDYQFAIALAMLNMMGHPQPNVLHA